jgi:hypothetical protein
MWRKRLERLMHLCGMVILGLSLSGCNKVQPTDGPAAKGGANAPTARAVDDAPGAKRVVVPPPPMQSKKDGGIAATQPSLGLGTSGSAVDTPLMLKNRIIGKWASTVKNGTAVTLTYEFTLDGKQLITAKISDSNPGLPKPPTLPTQEFRYKVINEQEIEVTTPKLTMRVPIIINGDEMNMANLKDKKGNLLIYKRVK